MTASNIGCPTVAGRFISHEATFRVGLLGQGPESLQLAQDWHWITSGWAIAHLTGSDAPRCCPGCLGCVRHVGWCLSDDTENDSSLDGPKEVDVEEEEIGRQTVFSVWADLDDGSQIRVRSFNLTDLSSSILAKAKSVNRVDSDPSLPESQRY
jgi:hypothetical protein